MISCSLKAIAIIAAIGILALIIRALRVPFDSVWELSAEFIFLVIGAFFLFSAFNFLRTRLDSWVSTATRPNQPQVIKLETKETPSQIAWAAVGATIRLFVIALVLVFILAALLGFSGIVFVGAGPFDVIRSLIDYLRSLF